MRASKVSAVFTAVIKEQGIAEIRRIALDVDTPGPANYGKFGTQEQLGSATAHRADRQEAQRERADTTTRQAWDV